MLVASEELGRFNRFLDTLAVDAPEGLDEAARLYAIPHYMKDIDREHIDEYPYDTGLEAAFKAGAEWRNSQLPKLPDSLDEAAKTYEAYHDVDDSQPYLYTVRGDIANAFKVGAEWREAQLSKFPEGLDEIVNSYLTEHNHDVLLCPYNALMEFGRLVTEWAFGQFEPIIVKPLDAWETHDVTFAPKLLIVDDGCDDCIVVPGFDTEFTIYRKK